MFSLFTSETSLEQTHGSAKNFSGKIEHGALDGLISKISPFSYNLGSRSRPLTATIQPMMYQGVGTSVL